MRKNLYCGVDLHSNNAMYVITDEKDKQVLRKRLPNELPVVLEVLAPFRTRLQVVAVESTYNWYWLVDGLQEQKYPVVLAHPSEMDQYHGIKEADDLTDAAFLARLARLTFCRPAISIRRRTGRCGTCCGGECWWSSAARGSF